MKWIRFSLMASWLWVGCVGVTHEPLVTIESDGLRPASRSVEEQYRRLLNVTEGREGSRGMVQDILAALQAVRAEEQNNWEHAAKHWLFVMKNDSGAMASMAFPRWVKAQERIAAEPVQSELLARLLWAQSNEGQDILWLKKQGLRDVNRLAKRIKDVQTEGQLRTPLPATPREIKDDPLWEKAAKISCRRVLPEGWRAWTQKVNASLKLYWEGLQASCRMDYQTAISKFDQALPALRLNVSSLPYAINAADRLVSARKSLGQREETARAYRKLAELLDLPEAQNAATGLSPFELWRKRIDTWFWVARSEALQGDYENAKIAVHEGFDHLKQAQTLLPNLSEKQNQTLNDMKAEGYSTLASRIAYEQKDFAGALALVRMGQDIPDLSPEWQQRLGWSEAWFAYSMNDKARAIRVWQAMLNNLKDDQQKPRYYYWIGRALRELDLSDEAAKYLAPLKQEFPLSFYSVIGLPRLDKKFANLEPFGSVEELESRLRVRSSIPWEAYRADGEAERRVSRLELMLAANVTIWLQPISSELFSYVNARETLQTDTEASLYVSRLLHMSGSYLQAIALTTQLSNQAKGLWDEHPEQLLVFFPRPYADIYQRAASQSYIDQDIPLAISRQESSFDADAVSPAEAVGLMQLMTATAQRQANQQGLKITDMEAELRRPEVNVTLGTAYLAELGRRYRGQWPQAFAAYNAGEYVVDAWLQRRQAEDPIAWIEALSFAETSGYTKNVWRNWEVYRWLRGLPAGKPLL